MSVRKDKDGIWWSDVCHQDLIDKPDRRHRKRHKSERSAQRFEKRLLVDLETGAYRRRIEQLANAMKFEEFWPVYFDACTVGATRNGRPNSERTLDNKRSHWEHYIGVSMGHMLLGDVQERQITQFLAQLARVGLGLKSRSNILGTLRHMLREAERQGFIDRVPHFPTISGAYRGHLEPPWFTEDELQQILDLSCGFRTHVLFAARTGARLGEIRALRWDRIDWDAREVRIVESVTYRPGRDIWKAPKSGKPRTIPLASDLVEALRAHPRALRTKYVFAGGGTRGEVTAHALNSTMYRIRNRVFDKTDITTPFTWHALRHTFASHLVQAGVSDAVIMDLCGWSDTKLVRRYGHLRKDKRDLRHAIDTLGAPLTRDGTIAAHDER